MLLSQIYFLPCIVSLLWFFSFLLKNKTYRQGLFCCAEGFSIAFYAMLGTYFYPDVDYDTMVKMETVGIPTGLLFPSFLVAYMYMHYTGSRLGHRLFFMLVIPAIVVGVAVNLLSFILGFDLSAKVCRQFLASEGLTGELDTEMNHIYCLFRYHIFRWLEYTYTILLTLLCVATMRRQGYRFGDVSRFFFRGKHTSRSRAISAMYLVELLIMGSLLFFGRVFISSHVIVGVFFTILLASVKHIIAYLEFYSDDEKPVSLYELSHLTLFYGKVAESQVVEALLKEQPKEVAQEELPKEETPEEDSPEAVCQNEENEGAQPQSGIISHQSALAQAKDDKRIEQFRELMEVEKIWMDEDLTTQTVCERMSIGKTTFSLLISQHFNATFRDLVTQYRIEEAKAFMQSNPKATQEIVSQHCGFKNAQYFNTQFKRIVGDTPAMWLAGNHPESPKEAEPTPGTK